MIHHAQFKRFEFVLLYAIIPLLFVMELIPVRFLMLALWMMSLYALFVLRFTHKTSVFLMFKAGELKLVLLRFLVLGALFIVTSYYFYPEGFLKLPQEQLQIFLMLLVIYPLISVLPQEVLFREFFFTRHSVKLSKQNIILLNAAIFTLAHSALNLGAVLLLVFCAGLLFAHTYYKTRSLFLVIIEHTLYGYLLFITGLGELFFQGGTLEVMQNISG